MAHPILLTKSTNDTSLDTAYIIAEAGEHGDGSITIAVPFTWRGTKMTRVAKRLR